MDIPEYYRKFQNQPAEEVKKPDKPGTKVEVPAQPKPETGQQQKKSESAQQQESTVPYKADKFTLNLSEDWEDKTIFTLNGPVTDGIHHNVIINVEKECPFKTVEEYASSQIKTLEDELKAYTLLKKGPVKMLDGTDAWEAVFSWYPASDLRLYQHQIYSINKKCAYKLTATFTKKTWKTLGPSVINMMLSLKPED